LQSELELLLLGAVLLLLRLAGKNLRERLKNLEKKLCIQSEDCDKIEKEEANSLGKSLIKEEKGEKQDAQSLLDEV
jgi:hypothetical protein